MQAAVANLCVWRQCVCVAPMCVPVLFPLCPQLGLPPDLLSGRDVHVHFPAGAVSKDGPSAGVAIVTALYSLFTATAVSAAAAMTGEITLTGRVTPVGGAATCPIVISAASTAAGAIATACEHLLSVLHSYRGAAFAYAPAATAVAAASTAALGAASAS
jgi:hypothetical protein